MVSKIFLSKYHCTYENYVIYREDGKPLISEERINKKIRLLHQNVIS